MEPRLVTRVAGPWVPPMADPPRAVFSICAGLLSCSRRPPARASLTRPAANVCRSLQLAVRGHHSQPPVHRAAAPPPLPMLCARPPRLLLRRRRRSPPLAVAPCEPAQQPPLLASPCSQQARPPRLLPRRCRCRSLRARVVVAVAAAPHEPTLLLPVKAALQLLARLHCSLSHLVALAHARISPCSSRLAFSDAANRRSLSRRCPCAANPRGLALAASVPPEPDAQGGG
ncbi:hypothetical protein PVAP13_4KG335688 [Panicum virgatum]|uniref:Uncharacterized protein n=1 Tax=Panicum virgatum TaxID=38727 RepID=A0A8T0TQJ4_PANVG|nr:hypothetical protein PVAP13_4KG335688 [Panicum virgatum]